MKPALAWMLLAAAALAQRPLNPRQTLSSGGSARKARLKPAAAAKQCEVRQLRAMTKHRTAGTDPLADTDALFAQIDEQVRAEAAQIAKRKVRR